jgi:SAM-dependent methyltransferase
MDETTRAALEALNRAFYAHNAREFDASRISPWRGFARALAELPAREPLRVLDLGCGNGRLLAHLERGPSRALAYHGIDSSEALLARAAQRYPDRTHARFERRELFDASGEPALPDARFDLVALLGVLHHVPSERARRALVQAAVSRVAAGGLLVLTAWRFAHDARYAARIAPWADAIERWPDIDHAQLEPGDVLLRWSTERDALRYCHAAEPEEIDRWLEGTPGRVTRFRADGSGELNEYVAVQSAAS